MKFDFIKKHKNLFLNILYAVLIFVLFVPSWFFKGGYLFFVDFVLGPNQTMTGDLLGVLYYLFRNSFLQKTFIYLIYLFVFFGGKKLIQTLFKDEKIAVLGGLISLANIFVYDRMGYGQIGIIMAYGDMLWTISYLLKILKNKEENKFRFLNINIIIASVFSGISIACSLHFVFFVVCFWLLFFILYIINRKEIKLKPIFLSLIPTVIIVLLFNIGTIKSVFSGGTGDFIESGITERDLYVFQTSPAAKNSGEVIKDVLYLTGFWGKDQQRYSDMSKDVAFNLFFTLILFVILYGVYKGLKERYERDNRKLYIGLLILFVVAFILAVGVRLNGFRQITLFLFNHVPFYKGLRETQKWSSVIVIIYAIFFSIGIKYILANTSKKYQYYITAGISVIILLSANKMLFGMSGQFVPSKYPDSWQNVDKYIQEDSKCEGKTLVLPWHMYMPYSFIENKVTEKTPYTQTVAPVTRSFFKCQTIVGTNMEFGGIYDNSADKTGAIVESWFKDVTDKNKLEEIGVKYVLLLKEADYENYLIIETLDYLENVIENNNLILFKVN